MPSFLAAFQASSVTVMRYVCSLFRDGADPSSGLGRFFQLDHARSSVSFISVAIYA